MPSSICFKSFGGRLVGEPGLDQKERFMVSGSENPLPAPFFIKIPYYQEGFFMALKNSQVNF
jgi:hypothetical protein